MNQDTISIGAIGLLTELSPTSHPYTVMAYVLSSELYKIDIKIDPSLPVGVLLSLGSYPNLETALEKVRECTAIVPGILIYLLEDGVPFPLELYPENSETISLSENGWEQLNNDALASIVRNEQNLRDIETYDLDYPPDHKNYLKSNFYYLFRNLIQKRKAEDMLDQADKKTKFRANNCFDHLNRSSPEDREKIIQDLIKEFEADLVKIGSNDIYNSLVGVLNDFGSDKIPKIINNNSDTKDNLTSEDGDSEVLNENNSKSSDDDSDELSEEEPQDSISQSNNNDIQSNFMLPQGFIFEEK